MYRNRWAKFFLLFLIFAPVFVFLLGMLIMWLWNSVLSPVLHVSTITFWQGLGILVLSKILFSSFGGGGGSHRQHRKQKMMWNSMTPEQKEKFRQEWRERCRRWGRREEMDPGTTETPIS